MLEPPAHFEIHPHFDAGWQATPDVAEYESLKDEGNVLSSDEIFIFGVLS